jgi:hypothetical protein
VDTVGAAPFDPNRSHRTTHDVAGFPAFAELCQVLAELELVSHAPTVNLGQSTDAAPSVAEEHGIYRLAEVGGRRPPGGLDDDRRRVADDRGDPDLVILRSADFFRRRLQRCHSERVLLLILADAREALRSYRKAPARTDPPFGSFEFKMQLVVAVEGGLPVDAARQRFGVSRSTVYKWLAQYSEDTSWRRRVRSAS